MPVSRYFELTDALVDGYVEKWPNKTFDLTLRGIGDLQTLSFNAEIISVAPSGHTVSKASNPISA